MDETLESRQVDPQKFGAFVAALRKEQRLTQKQLAEAVGVSDKAVSKWERGLSLPDIALLMPLGAALHTTVAELLRGERLDHAAPMPLPEVEHLLADAMEIKRCNAEQEKEQRMTYLRIWAVCVLLALAMDTIFCKALGLGWGALWAAGSSVLLFQILGTVFGLCLSFTEERLPAYYDENRIMGYNNGILKIQLCFIRISNRNWLPIKKTIFWGSVLAMLLAWPLICLCMLAFAPSLCQSGVMLTLAMVIGLGGTMGPMLFVAWKYQ